MTGAVVMTPLTPDAADRLERYVAEVRAALAKAPDVSPDEIEADVRAHIDAEFHAAVRPVTAVELEAVLVRLGPPAAWAAAADGPPAPPRDIEPFEWSALFAGLRRRVLGVFTTLWRGPEDWRLPYIGFGLFVLGLLTAPIGVGVLLLGMSYLFGRATAELAKEKGQPLGARRWLAYPGVLAFAVPLFLAFSLWPLVAIPAGAEAVVDALRTVRYAEAASTNPRMIGYAPSPERLEADKRFLAAIPVTGDAAVWLGGEFAAFGAVAAWWTVLGLLMWAFPKWPSAVFHPLLDGYGGGHGLKLAGFAGLAFFIWCGFAFRFAERAWN